MLLLGVIFVLPSHSDDRPNIIVIMADDMGYSDLGSYGGEIETPNLDRLAREGIRFRQFYNTARCCPTRASLLTGLYSHQAGMGGMVSPRDKPIEPGPYQGFLNDRSVTVAEALGNAGYRTYMSGKWHVGERPEHWPRTRGFDRYFGLISGASSYYELLLPRRQMVLDDEAWEPPETGFYMTDAFTDYAVKYIEEHDDERPFFLYVPYTAPHFPLHAPADLIEKYRGKYLGGWDALREERRRRMIELGVVDARWPLSPRDGQVPPWEEVEDKDYQASLMAVYAAMIERMDHGIGRILAALEEEGYLENSVVMFLADNGGCAESVEGRNLNQAGTRPGERGSYVAYRRPWANASNTPFRLFKQWVHEGGTASPLIVYAPKYVQRAGGFTDAVSHVIDLMPTFIDLAGARYPESKDGAAVLPLEGRSLVPILNGKEWETPRTLYWEHRRNKAVRRGDWKLVSRRGGDWELYNMLDDRTELNDFSGRRPVLKQEMLALYEVWAARCGVRN